MSGTVLDPIERAARAIAAHGLDGVPEPEPFHPSDAEWNRLIGRITRERIPGLAVESARLGSLVLDDLQLAALLELHRGAMVWALRVERKILALADMFDAEDIRFAVLKGASVAHTMYAEPCLRSFADLDLLVGTGDYRRACALLEGLGHVRRQPEPRPGFDVRFGRASVHTHPSDGVEVDLHRTPGWGPFGMWVDPEELLDRRETFQLAGRSIGRLDDTGMLVNVAMHASLGARPPKLVPLRDILQVMAQGEVDLDLLSRWAREWHLAAVLHHASTTATATLHAPAPVQEFPVAEAPRRETRALKAYTEVGRERGGTALTTLRAIPGVRGKVAYVSALVLPDREFLAKRVGPGPSPYLRRWRVPVRWARARIAALGRRPKRAVPDQDLPLDLSAATERSPRVDRRTGS
jgi:hypothetical protein